MATTRVRTGLIGAALLCGLTACGTTVPISGGSTVTGGGTATADGSTSTTGSIASGSTSSGTTGATTPLGTSSTTGSAPTSSATGSTDPGSSSTTGTTGAGPTAAAGSHSPVRIGFTTVPDAAAFFASFGGKTANIDQAAMYKNAIAWANKNGGLNGHPIQPFIESVSATSTEPYDQQYQELCTKYTRDDKVVAASMVGIGANTNMDRCMSRAKTLFITGANTLHDEVDYQAAPFVVSPMEVTASTLAKTFAQLVVSKGLEKKGGKLGILNYDIPEYNRAINNQLKPALAAAGIGLVQYSIPAPASTAAIGDSVTVVQSAELKMASQGVKTVTFLCGGCAPFFIQSANSQNYYPRYMLSSLDSVGAAKGSTYRKALHNTLSVGWEPNQEFGTSAPVFPVPHSTTYDLCKKIQKPVISSNADVPIAMITCDAVLDLYYAAKANPVEPISAASLRDGLLTFGTSRPSALSFATSLNPGKHAGASHYRLMTWNDAQDCPMYTGSNIPFPAL